MDPVYIKLPMTELSDKEKVSKFYNAFSVSQCLVSIDGTHVEIKRPVLNSTDYINRKSRYTLNVQAAGFMCLSMMFYGCCEVAEKCL